MTESHDIIIVGGGLSGLYIATELAKDKTKTFKLLEATSHLGGRLQNDCQDNKIDLGGAWIWPEHQPHMKDLVKNLGIETFPQPDDYSSTRIVNGAADIIHRLSQPLKDCIETGCPIISCTQMNSNNKDISDMCIELKSLSEQTYTAKKVIFAAPPRILAQHVSFHPPLSEKKMEAMYESQTWMAGVSKVALVYNSPLFIYSESNKALRAYPNHPAFQVYDGSPKDKSISVLTFFTLATLCDDEGNDEILAKQCAKQFTNALSPSTIRANPYLVEGIQSFDSFHVKHWSKERYISDDEMPTTINPHPSPVKELAATEWNERLFFAGSETDQTSPGVMEGAVGSAIRVLEQIKSLS